MGLYADERAVRAALVGAPVSDFVTKLNVDAGLGFDRWLEDEVFPAVEADLHLMTGRRFDSHEAPYKLPGSGTDRLFLPESPVTEVSKLVLYAVPSVPWYTFEHLAYVNCIDRETHQAIRDEDPTSTYEAADCLVDVRDGALVIPPSITYLSTHGIPFWNYTWLRTSEGGRNVIITGTFGYPTVPADVRDATAAMAALRILPSIDATMTQGVRSWSIGDESRTWGAPPAFAGFRDPLWAAYLYNGMFSSLAAQLLARAFRVVQRRRVVREVAA